MADRPNSTKFEQVNQPPKEGTRRDLFRAHAESEKAPSFIAESLHGAGLLDKKNYDLTRATDGRIYLYDKTLHLERELDPKSISELLKKEGVVQYEQIKYNIIKHAIADNLRLENPELDVKSIKEVQKVKDGYGYKYDIGDGKVKNGILSLEDGNTRKAIEKFEKDMANYGFAIEQPMSESIKKAVLKNAADGGEKLEDAAVQSYDSQSKKWYISSKGGEIKEFKLDNQQIEDDAELNGVKEHLKLKNGGAIAEAKFEEGDKDKYKVKGDDPTSKEEIIVKAEVDQRTMKKILDEKMINPDSHVTVVESKETSAEAKLRETNKLIDGLKDERESLEKWAKTRGTLLHIAMFTNQGAAQASLNLNVVERALQLGDSSSGMQPTTIQSSDKVFRSIDERHRNKIKMIEKNIEHLEKLKINVEKPMKKLAEENEKLTKTVETLKKQQERDSQKRNPNSKPK